jgi:hypothetical protein
MISRLKKSKHKKLLEAMESLIASYIELAFLDVDKEKKSPRNMLLPMQLRKIR